MNKLKELILENEALLYQNFKNQYGLAIQYFAKKIESLPNDGDIVMFLNNNSILSIKKDQYDLFHRSGFKTAIDIMKEYDKTNLKYTSIYDFKKDDLVNTMTISAVANNFNSQLGMYYNEKEDFIVLKCQVKSGPYNDRWAVRDNELIYYLQTENNELNYINREYKRVPNKICCDVALKTNKHTKIFLFYRYAKANRYFFAGQCRIVGFVDGNRAIRLRLI